MKLNRYQTLVEIINLLDGTATYNTLENIVNKFEKLTDTQISELVQTVKAINTINAIKNENIKNSLRAKIVNELEQYVSQL